MSYTTAQRRSREAKQEFAASLRAAAGSRRLALVRARRTYDRGGVARWAVRAYTEDFQRIPLTPMAHTDLGTLLATERPDLSWTAGHDYRLEAARWLSSPAPDELGFIPEDDRWFGGNDPVFLTPTVPTVETGSVAA